MAMTMTRGGVVIARSAMPLSKASCPFISNIITNKVRLPSEYFMRSIATAASPLLSTSLKQHLPSPSERTLIVRSFTTKPTRFLEEDNEYHRLADDFLEDLQTELQSALEEHVEDFDAELSSGVLTLKLGAKGTYVINKQSPNKQIWWSSPLSGPKRFGFDLDQRKWIGTRAGDCLVTLLSKELTSLTGIPVNFTFKQ